MKKRIMFCTIVFLLFVFTSISFGATEALNTFFGSGAGSGTSPSSDLKDTFIGLGAGFTNSTGDRNTFVGAGAGYTNGTGAYNTFLGAGAGQYNTASYNTFLGAGAGQNNTASYNTFLGAGAGLLNTTATYNTFLGYAAGNANVLGNGNVFVGSGAGSATNGTGVPETPTGGNGNTFLGTSAGLTNTTGSGNVFVGYAAGYSMITGYRNTSLGTYAGYLNTGAENVFLGYKAGYNETGSNKLYIANSDTASPLIYGDFTNNILTVNGNLGIGISAPARQLHIAGSNAVFRMDRPSNTAAFMLVRTDGTNPLKTFVVGANATASNNGDFVINDLGAAVSGGGTRRMTIANNGSVDFPGAVTGASFTPTSSLALKTNVRTYENALETVKRLRGVSFDWKESGKPAVGLIAEEVDKVIPAVVAHNGKAATGVNYDSLVGVLVEAVKEQQTEMDNLKAEIQQLKTLLQER